MFGRKYIKHEQEIKREKACRDSLCEKNVREEYQIGNNQQNRERLMCKIGFC